MSEKYKDKNKHTCTHTWCMLTHTYDAYTHTHTQAHTHIHTHMHTDKHTWVCTYIHKHTHMHTLVTLVEGINLRWAWESVLIRLCYTCKYTCEFCYEIKEKRKKYDAKKCEWVSECIHYYRRMHVTWIKAPQWCAWHRKKKKKRARGGHNTINNDWLKTLTQVSGKPVEDCTPYTVSCLKP